jgi:plastocyanin
MRAHRPVLSAALLLALSGCAGTDSSASPAASAASASSTSSAAELSTTTPVPPAGQQLAVQVAGGKVTGDTGRVPVPVGDHVTLTITSDVADEVHVHGYDLTTALTPGTPAELTFDATIPGVFEVELHEAGTVLLSLQVG